MDNGGANASMLEAARLLALSQSHWKRGLRICFWSGHSHGRYSGSSWYADEYWDELSRCCAAHVNLDSTGGKGASILTNSAVIDELQALAAEAVAAETGQQHLGRRHGRGADQSFWGVGIPSMFGSLSHQPPSAKKMPVALGWWWHTPEDTLEHIDPDNLLRDTRIALYVLDRLLSTPIIPLDYDKSFESLENELLVLQQQLGGMLDISGLVATTVVLRSAISTLHNHIARAAPQQITVYNQLLMRLSRLIVPLNYTLGNRFIHDDALPHAPWPALNGLRALAKAAADSDLPFYIVHARQTRNYVAETLQQAHDVLTTLPACEV